jgi:hypothetical protein
MRQDSNRQVDPIERKNEVALKPRGFILDGECFSFVSRLEAVVTKIAQLIPARSLGRACALCETFLAGCGDDTDRGLEAPGLDSHLESMPNFSRVQSLYITG